MKVTKKLSILFCAVLSLYIPLYLLEAVGGSSVTSPPADSSLVNLSSSSGDSSKPQVTMDPDGNGIISWLEYNGTHSNIQSVAIFQDSGWSDSKTIASFPGLSSDHEHKLAADPAGNVHIVWHEPIDDSTAVIKASMLPFKASKWSDPVVLSNAISFNKGAGLSLDFSGNGMAAWTNDLGIIKTAPFIDGNWVLPAMDFLPSNNGSNIKMAVDFKGNSVAVWEEIIDSEVYIMGAKLPFKGDAWIPSIAPLSEAGSTSPQVATNLDGDATAVWVDASGDIRTSTSPFGSDAWSVYSERLSAPNIIGSQPQIVTDFAGNTTIIWTAKIAGTSTIQSAQRPFASSWLLPVNISNVDGNASDPQIAVDISGTVVVAWKNAISPDNVIVQFSKLPLGGIWSIPVNLSNNGEKAGSPQIAIANAQSALVTWPNESLGLIQAVPAPLAIPTVTSVSPTAGPTGGGTLVTIHGTNFLNTGLAVQFGTGNFSGTVNFVSATQVTAVSPAVAIGVVDIQVTTSGGTSPVNPPGDQFSFQGPNPPTVTNVSPNCGLPAGGTSVTITGTNFLTATSVQFGTNSAAFSISNDTTIIATAPAGTVNTTVNITVTNPDGTSATSSADQFIYTAAPTVTGVSPNSGFPSGGDIITITGTNFIGVTSVQFGAVAATSFTVNSLTSITAISPAAPILGCPNPVDITVTNCIGTSLISAADHFSYLYSPPTVTGVSPNTGPASGGTSVTITGTNFVGVTAVQFGTVNATSFTVNSLTSITAISPAAVICGVVDVSVTNCSQRSSNTFLDHFTYNSFSAPTVTSINPTGGPTTGGTPVTITGTNFYPGATVTFGGFAGSSVNVVSSTEITVTSPAASFSNPCSVPVVVTSCGGASNNNVLFTYTGPPAPTVTNITPPTGSTAGGTFVTINGSGFFNGATVTFGGIPATSVVVHSTISLVAISPAAVFSNSCSVPVVVTSCGGSSNGAIHFTYTSPAPTVTSVTPNSGSPAGGTSVAIVGTGFFGVSAVQFGGVNATSFTVNSATSITAMSPAGTACTTVDVQVKACGGTSGIVLGDKFTYQVSASIPTVTNLNPPTGLPAGGTSVIITGTNFLDATAVHFGATPATSFIINSATQITAVAPAAANCAAVNVTVTNCVGTSTNIATFTYSNGVAAPVVSSISPNLGPVGTSVTINGTGFTNASSVKFGGISASFIVVTPVKITATAPAGFSNCTTVDITVMTCAGTSPTSPADHFTYGTSPTVTGVSPSVGTLNTPVTITGTNFTGATVVDFGGVPATNLMVVNDTTITVDAPAGVNCSTVDVTVTTCAGTSPISIFDKFTYNTEPAPTVTGVTPNSGPVGTPVTITGADFTGTTQVMFGVIPAPGFTVVDDFQISVNSPVGGINCQVDDVRVTTCIGTSPINAPADQYTYKTEPIPTVTMVSPSVGVAGTFVTITGTSFTGTEMVFFGATPAPGFNVVNDTTITVNAPAGTNCITVEITVMTCVGTSPLNPPDDNFEYAAVPAVTNVNPNSGLPVGGTHVTITGMNFTGATAVNFGGNPATNVVVVDDTTITADSPAGLECTTVDVTVMNCAGISPTSPSDHFSYNTSVTAPVVTSVSPAVGPPAGGTPVQIFGMNFTGVLSAGVFFGATPATSFSFVSDTEIDAVSPAGTACSTVDVRVVTCGGTSAVTPADEFTYSEFVPLPAITGLSPSTGSPSGGTPVTITGLNFSGVTQVHFGTALATIITSTDTTIMVTSPAGAACSTVNVTVTTCAGTSAIVPADEFSYTSGVSAPVVTGVSPNVGPIGQQVTITGMNFTGTTAVDFGGTPAAFVFVDDSTLTATAPISTNCDTVDITVTTCGGTSAISIFDQYTYETEPVPIVTGVSPSFGPVGEPVTITGEFFTGASEVMFGSTPAPGFIVVNDSTITVDAPSGINCQVVDVRVTTCLGTSPANPPADQYTYKAMPPSPIVSGVSPTSGPVGQAVTITGSGFIGTTMVFFGTTATTNFIVVNDNDISVVAPAASDCLVDVRVLTCVGTSAISGADEFTYTGLPVPVVTSVTPNTGPGIGGTSVVIKGMNFLGITAVDFGSVPATSFTVIDSMTIDAVSPMQAAGTCQLHVTVTGCAGTSVPSNNDIFIYVFMMANPQLVAAPVVTNVSPNTGPTAGGNMVVITGINFTGTDFVSFGGMNVPFGQFNEISDTTITAIVPALVSGNCTVDVIVATCTGGASTPTVLDQYTYQCRPIDPTGFTGCIIGDGFINKTSCTLGATWGASPSPNVVAYRIYRGDTIIAVIPVGAQFFFQTPLDGCTAVGFSITAVDSNGAESGHVPLVVVSG